MNNGFVKLSGAIITSSVWSEDSDTRVVWVTMLAAAGADGVVQAALPGLARLANVSIEKTEAALRKFLSPDPYSRSTEHEGRRIEVVPGGWRLLNYGPYRSKGQDNDGSRAPYYREYRRKRLKDGSAAVGTGDGASGDENGPQGGAGDAGGASYDNDLPAEDASGAEDFPDDCCAQQSNVARNTETLRGSQIAEVRSQKADLTELLQPRASGRAPGPANPLVDRPARIARGYELIPHIARHRNEDPTETLARASSGGGRLGGARAIRLETMSDDWLARTVLALEDEWRQIQAEKQAEKQAAAASAVDDWLAGRTVEAIAADLDRMTPEELDEWDARNTHPNAVPPLVADLVYNLAAECRERRARRAAEAAAQPLLDGMLDYLRGKVHAHAFGTWFRPLGPARVADGEIRIAVPSEQFRAGLEAYRPQLVEAAAHAASAANRDDVRVPIRITFDVVEHSPPVIRNRVTARWGK